MAAQAKSRSKSVAKKGTAKKAVRKRAATKPATKKTSAKKTSAKQTSTKKAAAKNANANNGAVLKKATSKVARDQTTTTKTADNKGVAKAAATKRVPRKKVVLAATRTPLVLGIDVGGSGIKGAPVDLVEGALATDRLRIDTPNPSTPAACADVIASIVKQFEGMTGRVGPIGVTYPGVVWDGTTLTAANVDGGWVSLDADALLEEATGRPVTVINDAQAAVLAEVHYGAGRGADGMVLMLTFGTGIGSGLAYRGVALPGVELGHLRMHGVDAEKLASAAVKDRKKLSWKQWTERVNDYLARVEQILWPELIILGGGVSEDADEFLHRLKSRAPIVPAKLGNGAGIVGAAIAASQLAHEHADTFA